MDSKMLDNKQHRAKFKKLEKLIERQKNKKLKSILSRTPDVSNVVDACGTTILHLAAKHNNHELIDFLIDLGFDVNAKNSFGATPLSMALLSNHVKSVEVLLNNNADLDDADDVEHLLQGLIVNSDTLPKPMVINLMQKLKRCIPDSETMVALLLKVNCPLKLVVFVNDASFTKAMLDVPDYPIGNYNEIVIVLKHVIDVADIESLRVLWQSTRTEVHRKRLLKQMSKWIRKSALDWEIVKPVFKQLDRWIVYNGDFEYFLSSLFERSDRRTAEILLRGCDVDVQIKRNYGFDVLPMLFFDCRLNTNEKVHELALERKFEVNARSFIGRTALYFAALSQSPENVRLLLDMGADCSIEDDFGSTALSRVVSGECCELLLQNDGRQSISEMCERQVLTSLELPVLHWSPWSIFIAQLAVERRRGLRIKATIIEAIDGEMELRDMHESCLRQVEEMMNTEVLTGLTLFDVVVGTAEKLAMYVRNEEVVSTIEEWCSRRTDVHSFYRSMLKVKTEKAYNFFRARSQVAEIVFEKTSVLIGFDNLVVDKVFGFLCYKDVMAVVEAF